MKNTSSNEQIKKRDIFYFRQRQRNHVYNAVLDYFEATARTTGINKKSLANKLGKDPAQITRWLSGAGNWELDTISDLLLALNAEMSFAITALEDTKIRTEIYDIANGGGIDSYGSATSSAAMKAHIEQRFESA